MSKKKKKNTIEDFYSCLITENMQNLINSLRALGYSVVVDSGVYTYVDFHNDNRRYKRAVTEITVEDITDSDGYAYEFSFEWDGTPIILAGYNAKYCKWIDD